MTFIILVALYKNTVYAENNTDKNVLILNSGINSTTFSNGDEIEFESSVISSINSSFKKSKKNITVTLQYMDYPINA